MGGRNSTPNSRKDSQGILSTTAPPTTPTTAPPTTPTTALPTSPVACLQKHNEHLVLAFFAGILLTLLLLAFVLLLLKSCRKCRSSPKALDPHSDPPAKASSTPDESLTYASMLFKISGEKTENHATEVEATVYAQVKR
ncbi:transmembrane protein C1orf162 homolog isoform X2 [Ochotona curzoniae]|uniref:transmembrane protein C1orf162 homolog isoform X2 n=1 Tax=Ochotona curzoniae TaxID=130825 RepID=UPI001B34C05B|nr:transmembrane protein C1orf162 homolog isoform X2 [Ochotona curzoniae]